MHLFMMQFYLFLKRKEIKTSKIFHFFIKLSVYSGPTLCESVSELIILIKTVYHSQFELFDGENPREYIVHAMFGSLSADASSILHTFWSL